MSAKSSIEWTDSTWTPLRARVKDDASVIAAQKGYGSLIPIALKMAGHIGPHCERVSPECEHCYSETNNGRCLPSNGTGLPFDRRSRDLIESFVDEKILEQPLHWKTPRRVFVCSQTDLFGEWVSDEAIDRVFAVMALTPQHTYQVLTKRADRMLKYFAKPQGFGFTWREGYIQNAVYAINRNKHFALSKWPLPNAWLGVSAGNQQYADERIPLLLQTPAAVRFVSYEPMLSAVDFTNLAFDMSEVTHDLIAWHTAKGRTVSKESYENYPKALPINALTGYSPAAQFPALDWIIAGYESGPKARPAEEQWVRDVKNQCVEAGVAFFYKQAATASGRKIPTPELDGQRWMQFPMADDGSARGRE